MSLKKVCLCFFSTKHRCTVLRIHLILMRIMIQILDPHWKKWIQIQIISLNLLIFFTKQNFQNFCLILFAYFMLKLHEPFINQEILVLVSMVLIWVENKFFFVAVFSWYCAPWIRIRIYLQIRKQEAKIPYEIQRIRILDTGIVLNTVKKIEIYT